MTKSFFSDPVVLICIGVLLFGFLGLIWAVAKFRRLLDAPSAGPRATDDLFSPASELRALDLGVPPMRASSATPIASAPAPAPAVSKEVADRLESMTQRLAEMQAVLARQSATSAEAAQGGPVGQGFSPETIDKLLKIIGNVVQQVDILQKNLNPSKEAAVPKSDNPFTAHS